MHRQRCDVELLLDMLDQLSWSAAREVWEKYRGKIPYAALVPRKLRDEFCELEEYNHVVQAATELLQDDAAYSNIHEQHVPYLWDFHRTQVFNAETGTLDPINASFIFCYREVSGG